MRQGTLGPMAGEHQAPEEQLSGLELLGATQSPASLTLHTSWDSSPDQRVKEKVRERQASLLGGTEQSLAVGMSKLLEMGIWERGGGHTSV